MQRPASPHRARRGFTLIELMVVVAVVGVLLLLVGPSFQELIVMNRLRGINAQLVTDLQFGRSEAVSRGQPARFRFGADGDQTCYVIYTAPTNNGAARCNCLSGPGSACPAGSTEIRTVRVPKSGSVELAWAVADPAFGFDPVTGGLITIPSDLFSTPSDPVVIDARIDDDRRLRNRVLQTGRMNVCAPNAQRMGVEACPS